MSTQFRKQFEQGLRSAVKRGVESCQGTAPGFRGQQWFEGMARVEGTTPGLALRSSCFANKEAINQPSGTIERVAKGTSLISIWYFLSAFIEETFEQLFVQVSPFFNFYRFIEI